MTMNGTDLLFHVSAEDFKKIPGCPVAYWVSDNVCRMFSENRLDRFFDIKAGICTGDNARFILFWHEVDWTLSKMFDPANNDYVPHNKGGEYRKWYGNRDVVLKYSPGAISDMGSNAGFRHDGLEYYFKEHIGWSKVTSGKSSFRFFENGFSFDSAGLGLFPKSSRNIYETLAFLNSSVSTLAIAILNPTLNVTPMVIKKMPSVDFGNPQLSSAAKRCIDISRMDWDSFETSWDFRENPLLKEAASGKNDGGGSSFADAYRRLRLKWKEQTEEMRRLEIETNRIFIEHYGLQDDLSPDVPWNEITLTCNPWYRYGKKPEEASLLGNSFYLVPANAAIRPTSEQEDDCPAEDFPFAAETEQRLLEDTVKELVSYAVGCMFGRYSLDRPGLAYAGGTWDTSPGTTFPPDADGIIPICDNEYFEDDIVGRFVEFMRTAFGEKTLEENLSFIAAALGGKGSSREAIRRYFLGDFYTDHLKTYQKRPIYWLFDSGKKNGFKCLIYMHRYRTDTIAKMRTDYVHEQQERYRTVMTELADRIEKASGSEQIKLEKQMRTVREQAEEIRVFEEKIHHLADQMIAIDFDDGVKHNYAIFQDVLAKIK